MRARKISILVGAALAVAVGGCAKEPILPRSFRAEVVETVDPARVRLEAEGLGEEFEWAVHDAQKAAMARVIQDLVQTAEERNRFEFVQEEIYRNVDRYVEGWQLLGRKREPSGDLRVRGRVVVNRRLIEEDLVRLGVIKERRELLSELEHPTLALIPERRIAKADWLPFAHNHAASYLTQRKYDVVDLEQLRKVERMAEDLRGIEGLPQDPKAVVALQAGADVYLAFDVRIDEERIGRDRAVKASASVKAYETTTGRQIGAATGFSKPYAKTAGAVDKAVAEALGDAIDRVLTNIEDYWKDDLKRGHQFLVTIRGDFKRNRQARRAIYKILERTVAELKENLATDRTLNYRVWFKGSNTDLLFALQDAVEQTLPGHTLEEVTTNRKLLVLAFE